MYAMQQQDALPEVDAMHMCMLRLGACDPWCIPFCPVFPCTVPLRIRPGALISEILNVTPGYPGASK